MSMFSRNLLLSSRSINFLKVKVAENPSLQGFFLLLLFVCLFLLVVHCIVLYPLCRQASKSE